MLVGDGAVQLCVEQRGVGPSSTVDSIRSVSSGTFSGLQGIVMTRWWRWLDGAFPPAAGFGMLARKLVVNQLFLTCTFTPAFMVWTGVAEPQLRGAGIGWEALRQQLRTELPELLVQSASLWLPVHLFNFTLTPPHFRVAIVSIVSVRRGTLQPGPPPLAC